jgi:hypothetical protein
MIWLGPIFKLKHLDIHPAHLRASLYLFGSIWGCPNAPKQHNKTIFWLFWTISLTRMGLMIWLGAYFQAWTYIPPTFEPFHDFLGPFGGAKIPQDSIQKSIIWLFWTISPRTMGLMIWLGTYF